MLNHNGFQKRTESLYGGGEAAQADVVKAASYAAFQQQAGYQCRAGGYLASHDLASFWTADVNQALDLVICWMRLRLAPPESEPAAGKPYFGRIEFRLYVTLRKQDFWSTRSAREPPPSSVRFTNIAFDSPRLDAGRSRVRCVRSSRYSGVRLVSSEETRKFRIQADQVVTCPPKLCQS
jgi:hypothetical protein